MCGISGEITFDGTPASVEAVQQMTNQLAPRGPDGAGLYAQRRVAIGHRRLKIIDLTERAQQPMVDPELGLAVAFNGCIYNYRDLRRELEALGYRFFSTATPRSCSRLITPGANDASSAFTACSPLPFMSATPAVWRLAAIVSASSRSTWPSIRPGAGCVSRQACRRSWPQAMSTRRSIRSRCIIT